MTEKTSERLRGPEGADRDVKESCCVTRGEHTHTQAALSHIYTRTAGLCGICEQLRKKLNKRKTMTSLFFPPNKLLVFLYFSLFLSVHSQKVASSE